VPVKGARRTKHPELSLGTERSLLAAPVNAGSAPRGDSGPRRRATPRGSARPLLVIWGQLWEYRSKAANQQTSAITVDYNVIVAKSSPISVRISERLEAFVDQEARRTGRSRSAVLEALADEALRMRLFPGIAFRGADWERRAWVIGTALDVWQIVEAHRDIGSVERMAAEGAASDRQLRLALA
jgi:hypothetical protein